MASTGVLLKKEASYAMESCPEVDIQMIIHNSRSLFGVALPGWFLGEEAFGRGLIVAHTVGVSVTCSRRVVHGSS